MAYRASVVAGVDTHADSHHAAVVDGAGRCQGSQRFTADEAGYRQLHLWLTTFGPVDRVGVEGTSSYGVGLTRYLLAQGVTVVEVNQPDPRVRRARGKSDPIDAEQAARAVLSGRATAAPKHHDGAVEAIRLLRVARNGAVKARTAALNQLKDLIVTAPEPLRQQLRHLGLTAAAKTCAAWPAPTGPAGTPSHATTIALRSIGQRVTALSTEITTLDRQLNTLVTQAAPHTTALLGIGPHHAGQLLITAGANPHRLHSEASFAALCAASPVPASTGKSHRHRLSRGGDRQANRTLHMITLVRMRWHQPTRTYVTRRTHEGLSKRDIIRCLKRYLAREIYHALHKDLTHHTTPNNP